MSSNLGVEFYLVIISLAYRIKKIIEGQNDEPKFSNFWRQTSEGKKFYQGFFLKTPTHVIFSPRDTKCLNF